MIKKIILTILCIATLGNTVLGDDTKTPKLLEKDKANLKAFSTLLTSKKIDAATMVEALKIFVTEASKVERKLKINDKAILNILKKELAWGERVNRSPEDSVLVIYSKLKPLLGKSKAEIAVIIAGITFTCFIIGVVGTAAWITYKKHKHIQSLKTPAEQIQYLQKYDPETWEAIEAYRICQENLKALIPNHSRNLLEQVFNLGVRFQELGMRGVTEDDVRELKERIETQMLRTVSDLPDLAYEAGKLRSEIIKRLPKNFSRRVLDNTPEIYEMS